MVADVIKHSLTLGTLKRKRTEDTCSLRARKRRYTAYKYYISRFLLAKRPQSTTITLSRNIWSLDNFTPKLLSSTSSSSDYQDAIDFTTDKAISSRNSVTSNTNELEPIAGGLEAILQDSSNILTIQDTSSTSMSESNTGAQALTELAELRQQLNEKWPSTMQNIQTQQQTLEMQLKSLHVSYGEVNNKIDSLIHVVQQTIAIKDQVQGDTKGSQDPETLQKRHSKTVKTHKEVESDEEQSTCSESEESSDEDSSDSENEESNDETHGYKRRFKFKPPEEKFNGNAHKVEAWLFNLEEYFAKAQIRKNIWIDIATSKMVDDAALWWRMMRKRQTDPTKWKPFKAALRERFLPLNVYKSNRNRLETLVQSGSVTRYNSEFQAAYIECWDVSEAEALSRYTKGLKQQTMEYVDLQNPKSLRKAMKIAEDYDNAKFAPHRRTSDNKTHKEHTRNQSRHRDHHKDKYYKHRDRRSHFSKHGDQRKDDPMVLDNTRRHALTFEEAKRTGRCMACGQPGHIAKRCPKQSSKN